MTDDTAEAVHHDYLERWGMLFEFLGATRMMGKVLAWLLTCDPPEQSAADIAAAVGASAGSISTTTRTLVQSGFIERTGIPGERSVYFRVKSGMWGQLFRRRMSYILQMRDLVEEGLAMRGEGDPEGSLRLRELRSYCCFVERDLPGFVSRWEKEGEEEKEKKA